MHECVAMRCFVDQNGHRIAIAQTLRNFPGKKVSGARREQKEKREKERRISDIQYNKGTLVYLHSFVDIS